MKTKVLFAAEPGKVEVQERELGPPGPSEVTVRTRTSLISPGTERAFILGLENARPKYPMPIGYCGAGIVEDVGGEVTRFKKGDRVAGMIGHRTALNQLDERLAPLPDDVSFEHGAFLSLGVIGVQGVRKTRLELAESAMVLGCGIVGLLALQAARLNGAHPLIAVDRDEGRLRLAEKLGADATVDASDENWIEKLREMTDGGAHVVIEATGSPEATPQALEATRKFGRVSLLGCSRGLSTVNFYHQIHRHGISVIGAHVFANPQHDSRPGFWTWQDEAEAFLRLLRTGRFDLDSLITETFSSTDIEKAYAKLITWDTASIGTIIRWD